MNRRSFSKQLLKGLAGFALMESLWGSELVARNIRPIMEHWSKELESYCLDLRKNSLSPLEWQERIDELYRHIELPELLQFIDFETLSRNFDFPDLGVATRRVKFPRLEGLPERTTYVKKIFGMQKHRSVIPHGHSNMVSAHLVLEGKLHLRHYEKLREEDNHMFIRPSIDHLGQPGDFSSISDQRDNVHWFIAESDHAFTLDIILLDLDDKPFDIHNLDVLASESLGDGSYRAPILDVETALKKYGNLHH